MIFRAGSVSDDKQSSLTLPARNNRASDDKQSSLTLPARNNRVPTPVENPLRRWRATEARSRANGDPKNSKNSDPDRAPQRVSGAPNALRVFHIPRSAGTRGPHFGSVPHVSLATSFRPSLSTAIFSLNELIKRRKKPTRADPIRKPAHVGRVRNLGVSSGFQSLALEPKYRNFPNIFRRNPKVPHNENRMPPR